jgi:predicted negative regulator of RcsB-dependent stress response
MDIDSLLKLVGTPRDGALLRLALARLLAARGELEQAESHLEAASAMDHGYTAAWKELGKVRKENNNPEGAAAAWRQGIEVARARGDKQAEKEMTVFLKRLLHQA